MALQYRFQFGLRRFVVVCVVAGVSIGLFCRLALESDDDYDQLREPFSGLIEFYDPQHGFVGLHRGSDGELIYTPIPEQKKRNAENSRR